MGYLFLGIAIICEIIATSLLKASNGFTQLLPSIGALVTYGICFYFFSISLKTIDLNIGYAIWCGLGIVATTIVSVLLWKEQVSVGSLIGLILIIVGVIVVSICKPS